MTLSDIAQRKISELLDFLIVKEKIELGKATVEYLKSILPEIRDTLNIDFDDFRVNPGGHPTETANVELLKNRVVTAKITVKTAVSGNIRAAIKRMQQEKRYNEDGMLIFGLYCVRNEKEKDLVLGIVLIPRFVLYNEPRDAIYESILEKVKEKQKKEGYKEISVVAMNESTLLETAVGVRLNHKAIEENRKHLDAIEDRPAKIEEKVKQIDEIKAQVKQIDEIKDMLKNITKQLDKS